MLARPTTAPTSHDVARAAGVSQPTVSRALRGDPRLSEATRKHVAEVAESLGYVPSRRGRSLATRSTGQIGIVVSDLGNSFYLEVLDAAHDALRAVDMRMLVLTPDTQDRVSLHQLVDGSLDGVILTTTVLGSPLPAQLSARQFPHVLLNREIDDYSGDVCVVDNHRGTSLVAQQLLALGHDAIAAIFGPQDTSTGRDRERSFRAVLSDAGIALDQTRWRRAPFAVSAGHAATLELLDAAAQNHVQVPTALFCANDMIALGALNAIHGRGLRVPDDITVIGFDDVRLAGWEVFRLTTISQDVRRMVRTATELLLSRIAAMAGGNWLPPRRVVLPAQLVLRNTHGPAPQGDEPAPAG